MSQAALPTSLDLKRRPEMNGRDDTPLALRVWNALNRGDHAAALDELDRAEVEAADPPVGMDEGLVEALDQNPVSRDAIRMARAMIERDMPARPIADSADDPLPEPILSLPGRTSSALLSVGEVAVLASAGGLGKSTMTVALAAHAGGEAFGLKVAEGPVVLVSYEDSRARIANRLRWYCPIMPGEDPGQEWNDLIVPTRPGPLWKTNPKNRGQSGPASEWTRLWKTVGEQRARLVIIDPASVALADVDTSQTGPVRAFLDALTGEAVEHGCGVLIVAHDTKAARNEARAGGDPGAGAVAGSAAWHDAARGVLYLRREHGGMTMECLKSNYGPAGWGVRIRELHNSFGDYRGLDPEPENAFGRNELAQWRESFKTRGKKTKKAGGAR